MYIVQFFVPEHKIAMRHSARTALLSITVAMLAGCGGGSGGSSAPATPPVAAPPPVVPVAPAPAAFAVLSTAPVDAATAAPRDSAYLATFSVAPDPASISVTSVQLLGPLGNVLPTKLALSGAELRLTPGLPALPGATRYTVNLAAGIKDKDGRALAASLSRSFTTAPQQWGTASQVAEMPYFTGGTTPAVAVDKAGNVTAAWLHQVQGIDTLFASRLDPRTGAWSAPAVVHASSDVFAMGGIGVQGDAGGNAVVTWTSYANAGQTIMMARFVAATATWEKPLPFNGLPAGVAADHAIFATDGKGVLHAVFRSASPQALYGASFDSAAGTWSTAQQIEQPASDNYIFNEQVVADSTGNLTLGWVQRGSLHRGINVARYSAATGKWNAPQTIEGNFAAQPFALAADAAGGATLAWTHGGMIMDVPYIAASRFEPASGTWTAPVRLSSDADQFGAGYPVVVADAAGIATVVWRQWRGMFSARSGPSTAVWSAPVKIGTEEFGNEAFSIAADIAGNVTLLYVENGMPVALRYGASEAQWSAPVALGTPAGTTSVFANAPVSVIDASGNLTTVWLARVDAGNTSRYVVAANRFR